MNGNDHVEHNDEHAMVPDFMKLVTEKRILKSQRYCVWCREDEAWWKPEKGDMKKMVVLFPKVTFPIDNSHKQLGSWAEAHRTNYWLSELVRPNKQGRLGENPPDYLPALPPRKRNNSVRILHKVRGKHKEKKECLV